MKDFYQRFFKSIIGLLFVGLFFFVNTQEADAQCSITCPSDTTVYPPYPPASCEALVSWDEPNATGCQNPVTLQQITGPQNGTIITVGVYTITYQITDDNGDTDTCSFTLTVEDTVQPEITWQTSNQECPNDITVFQEEDTCGAHVTWTAPVASDACGIDSLVSNYNSGDFIPVGANTITYTAYDVNGNTNQCSFTVTVVDTTDPVIAFCPPDTTVGTGVDSCSKWVTMPDLELDEECPAAINWTVTGAGATPAAGSGTQVEANFNVGTSTVTYNIDDGSGNTTSCEFTVTVEDDQAPVFTSCPNDTTVFTSDDGTGDCINTSYSPTYEFVENCPAPIASIDIYLNGNFFTSATGSVSSPFNPGTPGLLSGTNVWETVITDQSGNKDTCVHVVTVIDDEAPGISSCGPSGTVGTDPTFCGADVTLSADYSDNCLVDSVTYSVSGDTTFSGSSGYLGASSGTFTEVVTLSTGSYAVAYTAHDSTGQTANCITLFTVADDVAPVLSGCTDTTIYVDGSCEATAGWTDPTATDNCDPSPTVTQTGGVGKGSIQGPGTYTITYEAEDNDGNVSNCSFDVIVVDTTSPQVIGCPVDTTIYADASCSVVYEFTVPDTSDNCEVTSYVATGAGTGFSGSTTPGDVESVTLDAGTYTYTYTATDAAGNSTVCEFVVTVADTTSPDVTCPNDVTTFNDDGQCYATVDAYSVDTSGTFAPDGGSGTAVSLGDDQVSSALPIGFDFNFYGQTYSNFYISSNGFITFSAGQDDGCCSGENLPTPSVSDNLIALGWADLDPPEGGSIEYYTIGAAPNRTLIVDFDAIQFWPSGGNATMQLQIHESTNRIEIHTTEYTLASGSENVTVGVENIDGSLGTAEPGFNSTSYTGGMTVKTNGYVAFEPTFPFADDNCTAETEFTYSWTASNTSGFSASGTGLFDGEQFPITQWDGGSDPITVTYTVSDTAGNSENCTYTLNVTDEQAPTIACPGPFTAENDPDSCGATFSFQVTASDNCNYTITNDFNGQTSTNAPLDFNDVVPRSVDSIQFVVTDTAGLSDTCYVEVSVADTQAPDLVCPPDIVQTVLDSTVCYDIISWETPTPPDNCDPNPTVTQITSFNNPDLYAVGHYEVEYQSTDADGNTATCGFSIDVIDNVAPEIVDCPNDTTVAYDPNTCGRNVVWDLPNATDNCPGVQLTANHAPGDFFPVGRTDVVYVASDTSGNTDTCVFTINVVDDTEPVITNCPSDITLQSDTGCGQYYDYEVTADDDCAGFIANADSFAVNDSTFTNGENTLTQIEGLPSGYFFPVGTTTNVFVVTDSSGNTDTCTFVVTVEDTVDPVIDCPADFTAFTNPGQCIATVSQPVPNVTDNCAIASFSHDSPFGVNSQDFSGGYPVGTHVITYTAEDIHGNTTECTFTLTVEDNEDPMITCPNDTTVDTDPGVCTADITFPVPSPTDNCGVDTFYHDSPYGMTAQNASGTYPKGSITVTYTVVDVNGNVTTCDFNVTVEDNENPVIACSDTTFETDPGKCYTSQIYDLPEFSDNCPDPWLTHLSGPVQGDTLPTGTYTVAYMVTDSSGNTATCDFTINVIDTEPPETNCIADITTTNDAGICGAQVDYLLQSPSDNCLVASVTQTDGTGLSSGDTFPVGVTTQSYMVTDTAGNTSTCSFTVTVTDDEAPVIANCPSDITVSNDDGNCSAEVTYTEPTITDNCNVTVTSSHNSGDVFPVGTTTVTYFAEDDAGNTAMCSFDVTVEDTEAPELVCHNDTVLTADAGECGAIYEYDPPVATDNCGFTEYFFDFETGPQGWSTATMPGSTVDYWNVYNTVASSGNNSYGNENDGSLGNEHSYIVSPALDLTDETVSLTFDSYINNESGTAADVEYVEVSTDGGNTWTTIHGVPTPGLHSPNTSEWNTLTYSFTGAPEGQSTYIRFRYNTMGTAGNAPDGGVTGWYVDNVSVRNDDQPATLISGLPSGSQFPVGTTTNVFEVEDDAGNVTTCSYDVTVEDNEAPVVSNCPSDMTVSNDADTCGAEVTWDGPDFTDNCAVTNITSSHESGDFFDVGTTTVTYVAEDAAGNTTECSFDVTVEDNEAPVANCPGDLSVSADEGSCEAEVTWSFNATDNCNVASVSSTHESGDVFPVGTTAVTYSVTDDAGNTAECTFNVTVTDDEDPVITACPSDMTVSNDSGLCSAVVTYPDVTATDNCPGVTVTQTGGLASGEAFPVGETTVTYMATDASGNTSTCGFTVTVEDNEAPLATCLPDTTLENDPGVCEADFSYSIPAVDNCPGATITYLDGGGTMTNESTELQMYGVAGEPSSTQTVLLEDLESWPSGNPDGSPDYNGWSNINSSNPDWSVDDDGTTSGSTGPEFDHTLGNEDGNYIYLETSSPADPGEFDELTSPAFDVTGFDFVQFSFWYHMHGDDMGTLSLEVSTDGNNWTEEFSISGEQHFDESDPWSQATVDLSSYAGSSTLYLKFIGTREGSFHGDMALDDFELTGTTGGASVYRIDAPSGNSSVIGPSGAFGVVRSIDWHTNEGIHGGTSKGSCNLIEIDKYSAAESLLGNNANCIGANYSLEWVGGTLYGIIVDTNTAVETIHEQDFSGQNDKGATGSSTDLSGVDWDIDMSNANLVGNNDWFRVENGEFEAHDVGGEAVWLSEEINIFPYSTVSFSIDVNEDGDFDANDYVDVAYSTDGGTNFTTITNWNGLGSGTHTFVGDIPDDDDWQSATVSASGLSGTDLIIRVTVKNDDPNEDVQFDNLHVEGSPLHEYTLGTFDNSGNFSSVATITPGVELQNGLAYNPNNSTLYGLGLDNSLYEVDINNGDATLIGNTGVTNLRTLEYYETDGMLYTATASGDIYTLDASTGAASFVSSTGIADMKSITFVEMSDATTANISGTYPVGTTTEEFIIIDDHGNSTTCSFDITVEDTEDPVITTCPGDIMEESTPGICGAIVVYNTPDFTDNCGADLTLVSGLPNGSEFPVGTTTQVYEVEDDAGNVVTCSFDVTVEDTEAPDIICPGDITTSNEAGECGSFIDPSQTITLLDEDLEDWSTGNPDGSPDYNGWANVNSSNPDWTVDAGGTTSGSTGPDVDHTVGTSSGQYVYLETSSPANQGEFDELYTPGVNLANLIDAELSFWYHMHGDDMGTLSVEVSVDSSNWTQEFSISGEQQTSETDPWIQATVDLSSYVGQTVYLRFTGTREGSFHGDMALDDFLVTGTMGVAATDNCPGVTTEQVGGIAVDSFFPVGTHVVTFMATDAAGNTATCSFEVTVEDTEDPIIECPIVGDTTIYASDTICGTEFSFPMATAADTCGIDNVVQSGGVTSGGVFPVGTTTVEFTATDVNGNTTTCSFDVIVVDTFAPEIVCSDTITVPNDFDQCEAIVNVPNPTVDEECDFTVTNDYNGTNSATDIYPLGTTNVVFTVEDASGNTATCQTTVVVVDTQAPSISCPGDMVVDNDPGLCAAVVEYDAPVWEDNCPGVDTTLLTGPNTANLSLFPVGTTTVAYMATDAAGNTATCSFDITVEDTEGPQFSFCPSDTVVSTEPGQCSASVFWPVPFAFDNCGSVDSTGSNYSPGDNFPLGTTTVTYYAEDTNGNSSICEFTITVIDETAPVIAGCPSDIESCDPVVSWTEPTATDNCSLDTMYQSHEPGSTFPIGTTEVTYIAVDSAGNMDTCSFDVTVHPLPVADAGDDVSICNGTSATIGGNPTGSATGGFSYDWSPSASLDDANAANPVASPTTTTTYTVVVTDSNGCTDQDEVTVTVLPLPTADAGDDQTICLNEETTIGGSPSGSGTTGNYNYDWAPSNGLNATTAANPSASPEATTTYTLTVTDENGCQSTDEVTVTVNPLPDASIDPVAPICENDATITLTAATSGGTWSGNGIVDATAGDFDPSVAGAGTHTIAYNVTDANGCSNSATVAIEVQPTPDITVFAAGPFCETDDAVFLTATPFLNNHQWFGPGIANPTTGEFNPSDAGPGQHEIFYTVTGNNSCVDTGSTMITVYEAPDPTLSVGGPYCENAGVQVLTADVTGGEWSGPGIIQSQLGEFLPIAAGAGDHQISYTVTNDNECTVTETTVITVNEIPSITGNVNEATCEASSDGDVNITVDGGDIPYDYTWSNGATTEDLTDVEAGVYDVTVTDNNGCSSTASFTVGVSTQPVNASAVISPATNSTTPNGAIDVTVTGGVSPYTYSWSNGETDEDISGLYPGTYQLTIMDAAGCSYMFSFRVPAATGVEINNLEENISLFPNPTSDNINVEIEVGGQERNLDMTVFDMLGRKMYEVHDKISGKYTHQIGMEEWASGQYMIRFNVDDKTITKKYVLSK